MDDARKKAGVTNHSGLVPLPGESINRPDYGLFEYVSHGLRTGSAHGFRVGIQAFKDPAFTKLDFGAVGLDVILALPGNVVKSRDCVLQLCGCIVQGILALAGQLVFVGVETGQQPAFSLGDLAAITYDFSFAALLNSAHDVFG